MIGLSMGARITLFSIDGRPYRLIVVYLSKLDKRKASSPKRKLDKEETELEEKISELEAVEFACEPDAVNALERLKRECRGLFYGVSGNISIGKSLLKRTQRGRPKKGEEAYTQAKQKASCFVLITNI